VLLALVERGMTREDAYAVVQRNAMKTWSEGRPLAENLLEDPDFRKHLDAKALDELMDAKSYLKYIDEIFDQCGVDS
jgi:adenylosuccinate lyase